MTQHPFKLRKLLPWLALGPVTGLLAWRMYRALRGREPILAGLYGFVIVSVWVGLLSETGQVLAGFAQ